MIELSALNDVLARPSKGFRKMLGYTPYQERPYIDEMMEDIFKLAQKTAKLYTDNTCYALRFEDLVSEQMQKLTKVLNTKKKGTNLNLIEAIDNRAEAFKFIATCMNNHARGLVIKHRQTKKRTIQGDDGGDSFNERSKHCEISIDSEEAGVQLQDLAEAEIGGADAFIKDLTPFLTPLEIMVINEINNPCKASLVWMMIDMSKGRMLNEPIKKIKLKFLHQAKGLGIPYDLFKQTVEKIGEKIKIMRKQEVDINEPVWNAAVARLEEFFMVQVPRSMEKIVIKRAFTLAARDQYQRWADNKSIKEDLITVGAQLPQVRAGLIVCYGVLYEENNKVCRDCSLYTSCGREAANNGLGDITIHPRLLNNRQTRVPIISAISIDNSAFHLDPQYIEVYNWIRDHFTYIEDCGGKITFKRPGVAGTNATALSLTVVKNPFKVILHSVEDVALIECGMLLREGDDTYNINFSAGTSSQIVAILTTHLQANYAINAADSVI